MKTQVQRRWAFDAEAMKAEAKKPGATLIFQWANDNPATQTSQVENLLSQSPDALILVPVDTAAAGRIVNEAQQQGRAGGGLRHRQFFTAKVDLLVVRNNPLVGVLQAQGALEVILRPKGTRRR